MSGLLVLGTPELICQDCIVDVRGHLRGGRYCGDKKGGERKEQRDEETDSARNHLWELGMHCINLQSL